MSEQTHVTEWLPAYALGSLEPEETRQVAAHLADCSACRAELANYADVVDCLALAAPDAVPPDGLKARVMACTQEASPRLSAAFRSGTLHAPPVLPWWQRLVQLLQRTAPAWGAVGLVLIVALGVSNLLLWREANRPGAMHAISLQGTAAAPDAVGTVIVSADGEHGALVVDGLEPLDAARQYQIWLIRGGQRTSGGVFSVDEYGYGVLWVSSPAPLSTYDAVGVTIEPAGGSPGPTGAKVLGGDL